MAAAGGDVTPAERKLLIWCGIMLVRSTPLAPTEADEIDQLLVDVRSWDMWRRDRKTSSKYEFWHGFVVCFALWTMTLILWAFGVP